MKCIKCNKSISDDSIFCQYCGKKQITQKKQRARSRKGQGSVTFHKGKQRYFARITNGGKQVGLGYYRSEVEAWAAVDRALKDEIGSNYNWTVEKCYEEWSKLHYPTLSKSGEGSYKNAWRYFEKIKQMKMRDVKTSHLQSCVNIAAEQFSRPQCEKIKSLASQLCKFAMKEDLINKNYADFLELPPVIESETKPFTDSEVKLLLQNDKNETVKIILILIYTGLRPSELLNMRITNVDLERGFLRGGSKTEAGKNRIIPISSKIENYVAYFYDKSSINGRKYLITNTKGYRMDLSNFRNRYFYRTLTDIGILKNDDDRHVTPYSCRHTFATMCDKADIDDSLLIKMIGHTTKKTTEKFYIHKTEEDMKKAIESLDAI